ncbi:MULTISPECIES: curli assembly protein CsgF [Pseudomonas]|uniref:Curli production assembly/transport component CsgF n=1 Tax=Pseudomonas marincola TaxID=437900 RepID=A0A1I7E756_9PSED|nr:MULTISPECIES: curli assembly protein CsgF [Pseudomonas]MBQ57155.1 curli production assembly protein CsgF [Pseudomonadaceae bacterium]NRH26085.1 curli production assembly protein CsgF [Pseudomonas sp. MS19]OEO23440.1 curli production assembly protein CsgF [Pseudomonas sp. J237]CAE6890348.1 Curli production assembly/transport component CsgF [Pseudomonas marincola]SFU19761.1 curli production assembly/transport component CsgF [Pseudomonas marincola]
MTRRTLTLAAGVLLGCSTAVSATELVYTPVNPSFGGNPINGSYLLGNAQAQNDYKDPDTPDFSYEQPSALDRFTDQLQSRLLSQLLTDVGNGNTGSLSTDSFLINIVDDSGALSVEVTDKLTGEVSVIEVSGLNATY